MASLSINEGTQTQIAVNTVSGTQFQIIKLDLGAAGVSDPFTGTWKGGTVNAGTVQLSMTPVVVGTSLNVVGTAGAGLWGTVVAASGAGTKQYVAGVDIVCVSGTGVEVAVTNIGVGGSTGAGVLARGFFGTTGGISKNFNPVQVSGANGTIAYWLGGAGTVDITIQYWQGV